MHSLFQPRLVNDAFGDPGLYLDFRDERRALLFDLGDITRLLPRELMRVSHVFVTHAHMDHFSGFDHLLRVLFGRKAGFVIYGGPNFLAQIEHKLRAYTWNVAGRYDELVIDARELGCGGTQRRALFSSRRQFARENRPPLPQTGDVAHDETSFRVRARLVDHGIPCLAYAIEEKAGLRVARDRLTAQGLGIGPWLRELKHALLSGAADETPIRVAWRDRDGEHAIVRSVGELGHLILERVRGRHIGYVTDLRCTPANFDTLAELLRDADLLYIESVFLDADRAHALRKNHLTARQAGEIALRIGARAVVPFHFSPRYEGRADELVAELQAAAAPAESAAPLPLMQKA